MNDAEQRICRLIDSREDEIIAFGRDIWQHAEMGYREHRTAGLAADLLKRLGMAAETGLALTGVKGYLKGKGACGPTVAIMAEMDGLPIANHPDANPQTGASHCCGHNAQLAGLAGAAMALSDPAVKEALAGNVIFFAVPAEEYVDLEYKNQLIAQGKIGFGGGKSELIRIGAMDDIHVALGHHALPGSGITLFNCSMNGFVNKTVRYTGRASHAAMAPEQGIDALNAATLAMHAIDLQRESFRDCDAVRVHGFLSRAGEAVNIVADTATMEYSIRARTAAAIKDAARKFDRAARAGAVATGCGMALATTPGYLPVIPAKDTTVMEEAMAQAAGTRYPLAFQRADVHRTASTDFGDVSALIPLLQFYTGGFSGELHSPGLHVTDAYLAYVVPAKIFALTACKLLQDGGKRARELCGNFIPAFNKETYLSHMERLNTREELPMSPLPALE